MFSTSFLLSSLALLARATAAPAAAPTATIADVAVIGGATSIPNAPHGVNKFLGIPFAQSPPVRLPRPLILLLGRHRFRLRHGSHLVCSLSAVGVERPKWLFTEANSVCAGAEESRIFNNPGLTSPTESEDCLYLNVYAPSNATLKSGLPVIVWFYGGNLAFGTAGIEFYDGSSFAANQNVVFVTLNYRTNAFGFSGSPELPKGQENAGFLDQRKALAWVQTNIAALGGDPTKVTLSGESSGALSVIQLIALPPSPRPFRAGILESTGGAFPANPTDSWNQFVFLLGCSLAPSQIACVRQIDAGKIQSAINSSGISFGPNEDGVTYVANTRGAFMARTAANVPTLHGSNSQEGRVFAHLVGIGNGVDQISSFLSTTFPGRPDIQAAVLALYPSQAAGAPYEFISQIITDLIFTCTTSALTTTITSSGYPAWRYYYQGVFPNLQLWSDAGAYHSSEIPQVFGTYPANPTTAQIGLSKYMQTAWANFAKTPQNGPGWPKLGSNFGMELGSLGADGGTGETTVSLLSVDSVCAVYSPLIAVQSF